MLYHSNADGTFTEVSAKSGVGEPEVKGMGVVLADINNDGWVDVFHSNLQSQILALFLNEEGRSFLHVSRFTRIQKLSRSFSGWSDAWIDYKDDGWKDLFSANGDIDYLGTSARQHDTLWENRDGRIFRDVSETPGRDFLRPGYQLGSAVADLNDDGSPDLVATPLNEKPRILLNSASAGKHRSWAEAAAYRSNRDAIGARLKLTTGSGRFLYNHVASSVGFMSSSDKRIHFGLAQETTIQALEIPWPRGAVQTLEKVPVDRFLRVEEPAQ